MIPVLFEKDTYIGDRLSSNGLGRLPDCLSCKVTEERNGVYECEFTYPVDGINFDKIQLGRIIGVTHDETDDFIQPFDIVSYSKPIDGIVTFHAVHASYRLGKIVANGSNISSLADALDILQTAAPGFNFYTDMTSSAYAAAFDGIPKPVKTLLGGVEGSILDTYGGEYEFSLNNVTLHYSRGVLRNFAIRYGVNMTDYTDETDCSETFTSCVPYWAGGETTVVGNQVDSGLVSFNGRNDCIPLDLTSRFESEPTTAQLEAEALAYMAERRTNAPAQNITVDFVRLQDLGFEELGGLMKCNLCDTIEVIFPEYGMSGLYKIVRVVWDVLADRYEEMELGSLKTTLSEALGITNTSGAVSSGGGGGTTGRGYFFGTCSTAAGTAAKVVTCPEFMATDLTAGAVIFVDFTNSNTIASPTLNVNSTGAKTIYRYGTTKPSTSAESSWNAGSIVCFVYDGTYWNIEGWLNTTYSAITQANIESLTGASTGLITGQRLTQGIAKRVIVSQTLTSGTEIAQIEVNGTSTPLYAPSGGTSPADYITEEGTSGSWHYRKWSSGLQEAWFSGSITFTSASSTVSGWQRSTVNVALPLTFADDAVVQVTGAYNGKIYTTGGIKTSGTQFEAQILSGASTAATTFSGWNVYVIGQARS